MKKHILLIIIITIAAILRLWSLTDHPAGFNADEAALGYNAYSLLQTGKDEYGETFPLLFKSFGDYKPGLYVYLAMPFVATLGLTEFAVRLPSALLGIGTVVLIYFLSRELFKNRTVSLLAALLLAISPWHLHFSRGAWETNVATFFMTLGIWLFLKGLKKEIFLFGSGLSLLLAMYTYQSPRLVVPVLLLGLITLSFRQLKKLSYLKIAIYVVILGILTIPLALQFLTGGGSERLNGLSFLSDLGPINRLNELRGEHLDQNSLVAKVIHNKATAFAPLFLSHYLDHFSGQFLFITGDILMRNKTPDVGQFYVIEAIFLLLGMIFLIRDQFEYKKVLLIWILAAPLASAMTYQTPHALRSLNMVIPLTLLISYGLYKASIWLLGRSGKLKLLGKISLLVITSLFLFEFVHYLESYYVLYPKRYPIAWEYGFKELVTKLTKYEDQYDHIVITDRYDQPYILLLFYKQYDPARYQPQAVLSARDKFNFGTITSFDKYEFRKIDPSEVGHQEHTLYIGTPQEMPGYAKVVDTVMFPDGEEGFIFAH